MSPPFRVCLLGFRTSEQGAMMDLLTPAAARVPAYQVVFDAPGCDFVVADADHAESLAEVVRQGLLDRTVYIGSAAPADTPGWLARPVEALRLLRELDLLVVQHVGAAALEAPLNLRELPDAPVPAPAAAPAAPAAEPPPPRGSPPKRILLVDDSEIALRYLESRLEPHGLKIERVQTSGKAIELIALRPYDMVFLDVELGNSSDLDGLALCQHIKRHHRHAGALMPVVVMVSAYHAEIDRARGALAGCDAYLGKPLDDAALLHVLEQHGAVPPPAKARRAPKV